MGQGARVRGEEGDADPVRAEPVEALVAGLIDRRTWLAGTAGLLTACSRTGGDQPSWTGSYVGEAISAGHRWRDGGFPADAVPAKTTRCDVLIVGAGIAGLSAARRLREQGIEDIQILELHEQPGGNSRSHQIAGMPCPLGAHYLPVPDAADHELMRWLYELGLARSELGRTVFNERHLCHSPQERVWHEGQWHDGLLPVLQPGTAAYEQAGRLARAIDALQRELSFAMPAGRVTWKPGHAALDAQTFAQWLDKQGISDPLLRWYLDYSCRDDYGAASDTVSAWAGIHYFASRHGFRAPGVEAEAGSDAVFTWPEGNAWLVKQLAQPLGERLKTGWLVGQVQELRDHVAVLAQDISQPGGAVQRWEARQLILALPLKWSVRLWPQAPEALRRAAARLQTSPWLVANLHLDQALIDRPGAPPAWDNVVAGRESLGYVDARHQQLGQRPGPTVITAYHAVPLARRAELLNRSWGDASRWVVADLAATHVDLPAKLRRVDLVRHGHAMSIPVPGLRSDADLASLRSQSLPGRIQLAHADLAGYSVFEEAFAVGTSRGRDLSRRLLSRQG